MRLELTPADIDPGALEKALAEAVKSTTEDLELFDATQAAQFLKVPVNTFRDIARRSKCGSFDFGQRRARWSAKQLRALLAHHEVKATAKA